MRVSVIGGGSVKDEIYTAAEELGERLGRRGGLIFCGGRGGVMEAVCKGCNGTDGKTVGILPGRSTNSANPYVDTVVTTGLGNMRNVLVVENGDVVVAVDGGTGTLSEIALALDAGKPVLGLETHDVSGVQKVSSVDEVLELTEKLS
ncbi:MAG: TIGR00725 family protein [Halobacteria archaeon]